MRSFFIIRDYLLLLVCLGLFTGASTSDTHAQSDPFSTTLNYESSTIPYNWATGSWSACSRPCGTGEQSRSVTCQDNQGANAPNPTDCDHSPRPDSTRTCKVDDCQWVKNCVDHNQHCPYGVTGGI
ncbi:MAG: thrombospondin type-1 domain-containing protein [Pseudomonadota bacterium]